jgi:hypothetical protein
MKFWSRVALGIAGLTLCLDGFSWTGRVAAQSRIPTPATGQKAGQAFKNVTTSTLKELSVDDFLGTMGVISAGLGLDCADCHPGAGSDQVDWVTDTPRKRTARRMIEMVATLNQANFGGVQRVTCWTCHHGRLTPATSIALDSLYDSPNTEVDDVVRPESGQPSADQILDKYIQAVGGAQRLAGLTSFTATGVSVGYGELGGEGTFTIYAKAPNQRTTFIEFKEHPERENSVWVINGQNGWIKSPRGLLAEYNLEGEELDGERLEAQLAFPGQIKQTLTNWRVGARRSIGDKDYLVVQGTGPRGYLATLYFDAASGLLARMVRYGPSPVGHVPVQLDYSDYRDVDGIKFPFEIRFSWLDGRWGAKIQKYQLNVPIDPAKFAKP